MQAPAASIREADAPVIAARLVPPGTTALVSRARLLDALDKAADTPLTLLAAPAGSGKTALLTDWIQQRKPERVAWLSLNAADNDRRHFWRDLSAALARVLEPGVDPLAGLQPPPLGSFDGFVANFINAAANSTRRVTVVLDDAQELRRSEVLADLDLLLEHAPAGLRLIMATRVDPSLRLQRLRVTGSVAELRLSDLEFTLDEARLLLLQEHPSTPADAIDSLWAKTEGWAAGLRIAALSLRQSQEHSAFARGFAGDHRPVLDYLIDEIFAGLPAEHASFLLSTAGLSRVSAPLADAVRGADDSAEILDELVRSNLLIVPLPGTPEQWYRYHPLFVRALLLLQRRHIPTEIPALHARAARWHAAHGEPLEAISHAIQAEDWEAAGRLFVDHWLPLTLDGDAAVLRALSTQLPAHVVRGDAEVAVAVAGIELEEGDRDAHELLSIAAELALGLPPERRKPYDVSLAMTMLFRSRSDGDPAVAVDAARRVLASRWDRSMTKALRALARVSLGVAEIWLGDLDAAASDLQAGAALADEVGNDSVLVSARGWSALVDVIQGRLVEAHREASAALDGAAAHGWAADSHAAPAHVALATVALLWNDLDGAERSVDDAVAALGRSGERNLRALIGVVSARLFALRGEAETGLSQLLRLTASYDEGHPLPPALDAAVGGAEARARLALGEHDAADRLATQLEAIGNPIGLAAAAAVRLGMHEPAKAIAVSEQVTDTIGATPSAAIEAWAVRAVALDMLHEPEQAMAAMERALDLAEPRGYRRPLLDGGLRTALVLRRLVRQGTAHRALVEELLAALDGSTANLRREAAPLNVSEPLSERELVVLRYMPTSMPYAEVASELFVSVNTVKTHVRHVYRKLAVDSRRDAVARAIELRLLTPTGSVTPTGGRNAPEARTAASVRARGR